MTNLTQTRKAPAHLALVEDINTEKSKTGYPIETIGVYSGAGSPGRTTIAINLASELAMLGRKVLLIDLDILAPAVSITLGLVETPAGLSSMLRLVEQNRLSKAEFERLTVAIDLGRNEMLFMPGLTSASRWPEITEARFSAMLTEISQYVDCVVLDLPQPTFSTTQLIHPAVSDNRDALLVGVLARLAKLVSVSGCDSVSAKRYLDAIGFLEGTGFSGTHFTVVNRFRKSTLGPDAEFELGESYEKLLKLRIDCLIPDDPDSLDRAMRNGLPLALLNRSSPARQAIASLAKQLALGSGKRQRRG